jgi:hypothetical protein
MDKLTISLSPKAAEAIKKAGNIAGELEKLVSAFVEACADGKLSFNELLGLISTMIRIATGLFKK